MVEILNAVVIINVIPARVKMVLRALLWLVLTYHQMMESCLK